MAAKKTVYEKDILDGALALLEREGNGALGARRIAAEVGCSTQPIYELFGGMEALRLALRDACYALFLSYVEEEAEDTLFMRYACAYLRFASERPKLFRYLYFDCPRPAGEESADVGRIVEGIMAAGGYSRETAERFHAQSFFYFHGLATALTFGTVRLGDAQIRTLLKEEFDALRDYYKEEK